MLFPELNALLAGLSGDLSGYAMHVDLRMGCDPALFGTDPLGSACLANGFGKSLNNGYEQLFIGTAATVTTGVPEPATVLLMGVGLVGLAMRSRRRG